MAGDQLNDHLCEFGISERHSYLLKLQNLEGELLKYQSQIARILRVLPDQMNVMLAKTTESSKRNEM